VGAIERVNTGAVAAQRHNDGAVSVEHNCSFPVALSGAGGSLATILQFERFRIDVSDSAFTGRTP
jgi:hypothetical protein